MTRIRSQHLDTLLSVLVADLVIEFRQLGLSLESFARRTVIIAIGACLLRPGPLYWQKSLSSRSYLAVDRHFLRIQLVVVGKLLNWQLNPGGAIGRPNY